MSGEHTHPELEARITALEVEPPPVEPPPVEPPPVEPPPVEPPPDPADWQMVWQPVPTSPDYIVTGTKSADIQVALSAAAANKTIRVNQAVYDYTGPLQAKPGQKIICEPGTVLDAKGRDFIGFEMNVAGVTVANMEVINLGCSVRGNAVWGDHHSRMSGNNDWSILSCRAHNIGKAGQGQAVRSSGGWRVANCEFFECERYSMSGGGSGYMVENNWFHHNRNKSGDQSLTKWAQSQKGVVRNNLLTDGKHNGLWFDINNHDIECYGNRIERMVDNGIFYEVSCGPAKIHDNMIVNCGKTTNKPQDQIGGIRVLNSHHVEVYGNEVHDSPWGFVAKWWANHQQVQKIKDRNDFCNPLSLAGTTFHHNKAIGCDDQYFTNQPTVVKDTNNSWN